MADQISQKEAHKMKQQAMFTEYPDIVEVDDPRRMLGGISKNLLIDCSPGRDPHFPCRMCL